MAQAARGGGLAGPFGLFAASSLLAVTLGCVVARAGGAPTSEWARNLLAWAVGAVVAGGLARWAGRRTFAVFAGAAVLGLAAAFLGHGQGGVHRWVQLGPLRINAAEILLPAALVACAAAPHGLRMAWGTAAAILVLLAAQPDASQATAYGGGVIVLTAISPAGRGWRAGAAVLVILAVVVAWLRPDPLAPVPEVEGIMGLAWRLSPFAGLAAWGLLAAVVLSPLARSRGSDLRPAAIALAAYAVLSALTPLFGAFPVPLFGMGMSPILGLWLGIGLLAASERAAGQASPP